MKHPASAQHCPQCGKPNQCAIASGGDAHQCWCMEVSTAMPASGKKTITDNQCLCKDCLAIRRDRKNY